MMAQIISIATKRPIDEDVVHDELAALLRKIARRMIEAAADPSASVSPDYELVVTADAIVMVQRQCEEALNAERNTPWPHGRSAYAEYKKNRRALRPGLLRITKLRPKTPVGLFAKALAIKRVGISAAGTAVSIADDLLECPGLSEAIWPATQEPPPSG
jgi:hypothetical protein